MGCIKGNMCAYLRLVTGESFNFLLQVFDLVLLLFVYHHLILKIFLSSFLLIVHFLESISKGLFVFLALCKLYFYISKRLFQFFDFSICNSNLLHNLIWIHQWCWLNHSNLRWKLGSLWYKCKQRVNFVDLFLSLWISEV